MIRKIIMHHVAEEWQTNIPAEILNSTVLVTIYKKRERSAAQAYRFIDLLFHVQR